MGFICKNKFVPQTKMPWHQCFLIVNIKHKWNKMGVRATSLSMIRWRFLAILIIRFTPSPMEVVGLLSTNVMMRYACGFWAFLRKSPSCGPMLEESFRSPKGVLAELYERKTGGEGYHFFDLIREWIAEMIGAYPKTLIGYRNGGVHEPLTFKRGGVKWTEVWKD